MIILAADTSTSNGSVAVKCPGNEAVLVEMNPGRPHSETLLPAVDEALNLAGLKVDHVEALAVGIGPGAFTGLRVGLATFKGWASASHLPVLPVSSLDAIALPVLEEGRGAVVIADARKGEVYASYYPCLDGHGLPVRKQIPKLMALVEVPDWIKAVDDKNAVILGTGLGLLGETGSDIGAGTAEGVLSYPSALQILAIGQILMSTGRSVGPSSLVPDYVRPPDAKPQVKGFRSGNS